MISIPGSTTRRPRHYGRQWHQVYDGSAEATLPTQPGAATWITDALRPGDMFALNPFELPLDETER